jgi:signal transduction histidine kinase
MVRPAEPSRHEAATGAVAAHAAALATVEAAALARGDLAMERVRGVRAGVLMFQGLAVITAVAAALTAMLLHRRWIVTPVERLRAATERLATGDLEHRAPEEGTDELALLGREVNQMTARVRRMQAEAVERERFAAIGQVVRRLTHNIRNPLAGIRGLAEMSRAEPDASETVRDAQERIIETVDRFDRWLTDFLRATAPNEVTPRESDARRWLASSLRAIEPLARAAQVRLIVESEDAPERARFDPVHMEQALVALATNAIEASPRGGVVRVSAATEPNAWVLTVEDDGPGVPEELAERIFEPEYSTKSGGHGIGLAAARWIVRSHGGTIGLQPRGRGAGACFVIRLPLAEASDHHASEQGEAES